MGIDLPEYARVVRGLPCGDHPYRTLLPRIEESPVRRRIETPTTPFVQLVDSAVVRIKKRERGYCYVDVLVPAVTVTEQYYRNGNDLDLYLDLAHELTHLRQHLEGENVWDHGTPYVDRATEIEGYAVAIEEGRRLGMLAEDVMNHLSNPWMSSEEVTRLLDNIEKFLAGHPLK
jgi:hypothetical protein